MVQIMVTPTERPWWRSMSPGANIKTSAMLEELDRRGPEGKETPPGLLEFEWGQFLRLVRFIDTSGLLQGNMLLPREGEAAEDAVKRNAKSLSGQDKAQTLQLLEAVALARSMERITVEDLVELDQTVLGLAQDSDPLASKSKERELGAFAEQVSLALAQGAADNISTACVLAGWAVARLHNLRAFKDGNKRVAELVSAVILRRQLAFPFRVFESGHDFSKYTYVSSCLLCQKSIKEEDMAAFVIERVWVGAGYGCEPADPVWAERYCLLNQVPQELWRRAALVTFSLLDSLSAMRENIASMCLRYPGHPFSL